ncbi:MAG TPA: CHAD domain-containing protein [Solirubrobacteraceae bacterium]|nr:CHAD domain-containing protein [Solirubrobacteraceae bacterium]
MAPLAARMVATLAATMAVGVGVALARAERDRRSMREPLRADRRFGPLAGERPAEGFRRMALGQLDLALELLGDEDGVPPDERAVHETRKALKRLRALVRLLRPELGEGAFARETAALRETGRRLAGARDAEVMVGTLDGLLQRHPRKLGRRPSLRKLRGRLLSERDQATELALGDAAARRRVLEELRAARGRVAHWQLRDRPGIAIAQPGLERLYRQGRNRYMAAAGGRGDRGRALHEWRKRVKDLRYAAEMLGVGRLARRADRLGETLGEDHDLALLAARVRRREERSRIGRRTRKTLLKLIARRRRELRERALSDGARLYRRPPKRFVRRLRRAAAGPPISRR